MKAREGVKRMIWGAVLFLVVSPLIFVLALVFGLLSTLGPIGDLSRISPGGKATLGAGQRVVLFVDASQSPQAAACTVTGPDGRPVALSASTGTTADINGAEWREVDRFTAEADGEYTVDCGAMDALVVDRSLADRVARGIGLSVAAAVILPFVTGVAGAWLFIWGLIRYRASRARATEPGAGRPYEPPPPPTPPSSSYEPPRS